jgi:hypothetical protein
VTFEVPDVSTLVAYDERAVKDVVLAVQIHGDVREVWHKFGQ